MQNVPQIVRDRLKAAPPAVNHPDADVLTAFAERSLPALERDSALEHLARCGECREIVALSLPATEEAAAAVAIPTRGGWLAWPTFRWGFAAAGIVAIALVGIVGYQRTPHRTPAVAQLRKDNIANYVQPQVPAETASTSTPVKTEDKGNATGTAPTSARMRSLAASAASSQAQSSESRLTASVSTPTVHLPQSRGSLGGLISGTPNFGPKIPAQQQQQQQIAINGQAPPPAAAPQSAAGVTAVAGVPSNNETVEVAAGATLRPETNQTVIQAQNLPVPVPGQPSDQLFDNSTPVGKAKAAVTAEAAAQPGAAGLNGRNYTQLASLTPGLPPRWAITSTGGLQRSLDGGNSWQDVDVNAAAASTAYLAGNLASSELAVVAPEANVPQTKQETKQKDRKKTAQKELATPVFRAISAAGAEVWVGGSQGALYHSIDAGNHWTRVVPQSGGAILTADILRVEFSDAQHGKITTSSTEIWTTSDNGQTWQKQ
jgi:hypothetical protein